MKVRDVIHKAILDQLTGLGVGDTPVVLERPRDPSHGDISTPVAMALAKSLRRNPVEIAEMVAGKLHLPAGMVDSVEVIKPGFINFRLSNRLLRENLLDVVAAGDRYGSSELGAGARCQVEYVSANPTGPLVVVSARAAAVGSVLVNLLRFVGYDVEGEYYVNDYGNQVAALGSSLRYRLREAGGTLSDGEELGAYPGEYLRDIARGVPAEKAANWLSEADDAALGAYAAEQLLGQIENDLDAFGVHFDNYFRESTLHPHALDESLELIKERGYAFEQDGAIYFRTTDFGDDKDRVLVKSDGNATYFLGDIAYHLDKYRRGFQRAIGLLGPDHHGHVPRMKAAAAVIGAQPDWLEILIVGWVRLLEDGSPVSMSKRAGEFVTMRDLIDDVGADVAKYFFLMRRANSPLDFDLTLARKQSDENPVYYVQYAHARISSVARFAREKGCNWHPDTVEPSLLVAAEERALMLHLLYFHLVVEGAATSREPHRLTTYAQELATSFHQFYHQCRIVSDNAELSSARLMLAEATMQVLRNSLDLLGVSAPSSM